MMEMTYPNSQSYLAEMERGCEFRMFSLSFTDAEAKKIVMAQEVKTFNFSDTLTFIAHLLSHMRK